MAVIDNNPEYVVLYATTECNHRCSHCFVEQHMSWNPDELERMACILSKKCLVHINGAEPLLNSEYLRAYKAAGQNFIFTNGLVFLQDNAESLLHKLRSNGIEQIRLSHHFQAAKTLNSVSPEVVEQITTLLIEHGFEVHYNSTVTSENLSHVEENCDRAHRLGVKRIKFFPLMNVGHATTLSGTYGLTKDDLRSLYDVICSVRTHYDISDLKIRVDGDLSGIAKKFVCTYGVHSYVVMADRNVYGCVFAISDCKPIGKLLDDGTISIDRKIEHDGTCCLLSKGIE